MQVDFLMALIDLHAVHVEDDGLHAGFDSPDEPAVQPPRASGGTRDPCRLPQPQRVSLDGALAVGLKAIEARFPAALATLFPPLGPDSCNIVSTSKLRRTPRRFQHLTGAAGELAFRPRLAAVITEGDFVLAQRIARAWVMQGEYDLEQYRSGSSTGHRRRQRTLALMAPDGQFSGVWDLRRNTPPAVRAGADQD